MDYLAAKAEVPYAAHGMLKLLLSLRPAVGIRLTLLPGYAAYYCLSILDKHHNPNIDLGQGKWVFTEDTKWDEPLLTLKLRKLLKMCIEELRHRMPIEFKGMRVKVVSAEGITELEEF
jgi:20S proteasome subunit beta 4